MTLGTSLLLLHLKIPMNHTVFVHEADGRTYLRDQGGRLVFRVGCTRIQIPPTAILHDDVYIAFRFVDLVRLDNVRMIESSQDIDLIA